jgi:hypothetical protein
VAVLVRGMRRRWRHGHVRRLSARVSQRLPRQRGRRQGQTAQAMVLPRVHQPGPEPPDIQTQEGDAGIHGDSVNSRGHLPDVTRVLLTKVRAGRAAAAEARREPHCQAAADRGEMHGAATRPFHGGVWLAILFRLCDFSLNGFVRFLRTKRARVPSAHVEAWTMFGDPNCVRRLAADGGACDGGAMCRGGHRDHAERSAPHA